jgi:DNA-binding response OmpR family regulator
MSTEIPDRLKTTAPRPSVLVVDDDPDLVRFLVNNLWSAGYESIWTAYDGEEALAIARATSPGLVLTDIMMPRVMGYELVEKLRAEPGTKNATIMFISSKAITTDIERGLACGVEDYVILPYHPTELLARIRGSLERRRSGVAPPRTLEELRAKIASDVGGLDLN